MNNLKSVLIIDDDPEFLFLLKMALEVFGKFEVTRAEGGVQGTRLAKSRRYEIIITDLIMPDLDGEKVVREIRESKYNRDTLLIVLSGNSDVAEALQMKHVVVLAKPIEPKELVNRLMTVWQAHTETANATV